MAAFKHLAHFPVKRRKSHVCLEFFKEQNTLHKINKVQQGYIMSENLEKPFRIPLIVYKYNRSPNIHGIGWQGHRMVRYSVFVSVQLP